MFIELVYIIGYFSDTCTVSNTDGRRFKISLQIDRTGSSISDVLLDVLTDAINAVWVKRTLYTSCEIIQFIDDGTNIMRDARLLIYRIRFIVVLANICIFVKAKHFGLWTE